MDLRTRALAATNADTAARADSEASQTSQRTAAFTDRLRDYFTGETVTALESVSGEHPELYPTRFDGEEVRWMPHSLVRAEVGGVVFVDGMQYKSAYVEVACGQCQAPAYPGLGDAPWGCLRGESKTYAYVRQDRVRAQFLVKIGKVLAEPALCWNCATRVPRNCPTCHRANPA